mgnify:CR=1 FL=1
MKNNRTELSQRVRHALLAGVAGAFLIPQVAFAAPTGENVTYGGAVVSRSGNDTNINSGSLNNVIEWRDYSLTSTERVVHDGGAQTNNYLNIVTGANTSNINGKIVGGKDVYIVNPNGVIFGKSAEVNVGNLYVSTQEKATLNQANFMGSGGTPLVNTAALKSDVINMGKITANTVEVHGSHIRFLNAADVTATNPVVLYTDAPAASPTAADGGYAHIGYRGTAPTNYTRGGTTGAMPEYYQLVATQSELNNINTNATTLNGKYMLEQDIDFAGGSHTPIGTTTTPFTGKFDGNLFRIKNFTATHPNRAGLFGVITNARIENLGVTGASITGGDPDTETAGGIAASATGSLIKNVYVKDSVITSKMSDGVTEGAGYVGGIVGVMDNTTIDSAYAKNRIGGNAGGIVGATPDFSSGSLISNSYNDSEPISAPGMKSNFIYLPGDSFTHSTTITNSYNVGLNFSSNKLRLAGGLNNVYELDTATNQMRVVEPVTVPVTPTRFASTAAASYSGWSINNTGEPGAKWRIYEGRTLPYLTAFMGVSSEATYSYRYFKADGTASTAAGNTVKTNSGADMKNMEYNSHYVKIVDSNAPNAVGGKPNVKFGAGADTSGVVAYVTPNPPHTTTNDFDKKNGIRDVGTKAILWTDQDGPNLRGVNVTIKPRVVSLNNGSISPSRMYNGKSDVTKAFREALTSGGIGSTGFTAEDIANGSVALDFTTGNFKARAVDGSNNPDRNVGTNKPVKFSGSIGFSGPDAGNYEFDTSSLSNLTGSVTIKKAPLYLSIQKKTADDKIYDGTSTVIDSAMLQTNTPPNIKLDDTKTGLTLAQIDAGTPAMPDGAIMTGDDDTTRDNVGLTTVGGPKYTNAAGVEQLHAGTHKLQYTNVGLTGNDAGNYELYYTPASGTKTLVSTTDKTVYLDGTIIPRQILRDNFNVYDKTTHAKVDAKKVYDGNDEYTPTSDVYISSNAVTGGTTGLVERDRNHITFALTGGKGRFAQNDGTTYSKDVKNVEKLAYEVTGQTDDATNYRLSDYYIMDGGVKKSLGSTFHATGAGKITPKALTATVVNNHITKVYDAMDDQTDGNRNIIKGDALVTLSGFVGSETRTNTSTAKYASKNVVLSGGNPTTQAVTYTASFDRGTGAESDNYTLGTQGALPALSSKTLSGSYTGTITPRPVKVKFADATKIYDGTVTNTSIVASGLDDGLSNAVLGADGLSSASVSTTGVTSRFGDNKTSASFTENRNAGNRSVEYVGLSNSLGTNYSIDNKQYGDGTITRRRIDPSGFKVRKADGTLADATKVYDGTDTYTLDAGAYLTGSAASGNTGIVTHDFGKVVFELKSGSPGHFTRDAAGTNRTSHVSEAQHIAYDVVAKTLDATNNPLTNYEFGTALSKRNLETVTAANPASVTAGGRITPRSLRANTQEIEKVYDGLAAHTDGNRVDVKGDSVISFTGWATGQTRNNNSSAVYADKNVSRDGGGNVIKKTVTYMGQLTGQYADDYQIVDAGNNVISTAAGSGAATTVTMNAPITVANAGKITPRKLNIKMGDVSKTYDGTAANTSSSVTQITDDPVSSVIGTILSGDSITAGALQTAYNGMLTANTATSTYGRGTTTFTANPNASNGTPHDVQYTNMNTAFSTAFGGAAGNYTVDALAYGKGTINRRDISPNGFKVKDLMGNVANATKVYDGSSSYTVPTGWQLVPNSGGSTGVVAGDNVNFRLAGSGAKFLNNANAETANAFDATKVAYQVEAYGDAEKIKNYKLNGQNLESGTASVHGAGTITRRALELNLVQSTGIDKEYDRQTTLTGGTKHWNALTKTDSAGNVQYATGSKELVNDGTSFNITSNYMNDAGTAPDKNVKRSGGNVVDKNIQYDISITGGDARNYSFTKNGVTSNAEGGLKLSATGKITPKDLSGAFKKVTKVYDGTKNVPAAQVGFVPGNILAGDTVTLGAHTETFQSANVNGDGTTWTPTGGTSQKNWVNYSGLTLAGADAGNYTIDSTTRGLGEITPLSLNPSSINFNIAQATKTYDGTTAVKHNDSAAMTDVKNYITSATTTVNSTTVDVLPELSVNAATYDTKDVDGGRSANRVTYTLKYTGASGNFTIGSGTFTKQGNGVITKKDVTATVKSPVSKVYDATTTLTGVAKNSANAVVTNANDLIGMTGFTGNDGATYTTTAVYADKNAGTGNKQVDYTLTLDSAAAGNYNLKYNGANSSGTFSTNNNTITKRTVGVNFAHVTKTYDGTTTNTSITPSVSADDAAVLSHDSAAHVSGTNITGLTGITSQYGTGTDDGTFAADPNAAASKSVQYAGLGAAMGTAFGANNYEFAANGYGTGTINKANINTSDITFATTGAHKVYDGTRTVKYNGSSASAQVKNYITTATANLGGGHTADLRNDLEIDAAGTHYSSPNATNGTPDTVTYKFRLNNNNIEISGRNEFEMTDSGTIDRRVLNLDLRKKSGIDKIYDANANLVDTNTHKYGMFTDDDASGNVTYAAGTTDENKLVRTANGAAVNDGATMTIQANYVDNLVTRVADKNVARSGGNVTTKDIGYRVSIDAANGGQNYKLSDGVTTVNAETGLNTLSARGTISPRALTLGFADVSKPYDTTAVNNTKNINSVVAADSDGRGAATLTADGITAAVFNTAGVQSQYGSGDTDATFHPNPNVVTDANGNVVERGKDVQYTNLGSTLSGAHANNYTVADTAYGKGTIRKRVVSVNDFNFNINNATKEYDGTKDVEWHEGDQTYKDMAHVKRYFQNSTLDLGGGNTVPINLDDISLNGAQYNDENVAHANGINYDVTINAANFEFNGGRNRTINHTGDTITKRNLATRMPKHIVKEYDAEQTFDQDNRAYVNAVARENLTGVVDRDKSRVQLAVTGTYSSPDASTETREEAEARTPGTAGLNVNYALTLSGDAATLSNYRIGAVDTPDSDGKMRGVGSGKGDIYKKTLTVGVDNIDKLYDGTRTVVRPDGMGTAPHPEAGKFRLSGFVGGESFSFDQTAADKIDGLYSDPNVSRRNGAVVDKDISYSGLKTALADYAGRNATGYAKNYRIDSDTLSGKGKILPRPIRANDITNGLVFDSATKVYDGTRAVKYNGQNTPDALKNYLTRATVNIGGTDIDIRNDLTIRSDEDSTHYDNEHVAGGAQPRVTYGLTYTGGNFDISGDLTKQADGVITKRKVMAYAPGQLTKIYDGTNKVYDPTDTSIKTYRRGTRVTDGDSIVRMSTEDGDTGLLTNDGVRNISTATFDDKNVGTRKTVTYNVGVDAAHAGDYEIVDTLGNTISQLTTRNNSITPRRLDLTFDHISKSYDATSTNDETPATYVTDGDTRKTLQRDHARIFGNELILRDGAGNDLTLPSDYGYGRTDRSFTPDANADTDKSVQYRGVGDALRTILGDDAQNYEFDETGYGTGTINKANVRESDFDFRFRDAEKEYDGTSAVSDAKQYIDKGTSRVRLPRSAGWKNYNLPDTDIAGVTGTYMSADGRTPDKHAADRKIVDYKVQLNNRNFDFDGGWDGVVTGEGRGKINRRAITAAQLPYLTKTYDGTNAVVNAARDAEGNLITGSGDALMQFRHKADANTPAFIAGDDIRNDTTASYADKNVAWQDDVWKNGHGTVIDKDVNYTLAISGADAANYKIVDSNGNEVTSAVGKGRINPQEIHLKADEQTRWINDGLPKSYTGTPSGKNYETGVNGEVLPGEIYYDSPNGRLRWGDYAINGYYRAADGSVHRLPDGTADGDTVSRNYRFVQDPANATALHMGPYLPDYEYYKALVDMNKMTPDEYAYENASLDRRNHFGRKAEAEVSYTPPSINMVKDGTDISKTGIRVTDETVFTLMNEVFGEQ